MAGPKRRSLFDLLADRLTELANYEDAIGLYDWVMRSRQVDKLDRVTAGMLAGITTARYLSHPADAKIYWHYVLNEFDEFKFFSLQATFLNGTLSELTSKMGPGRSEALREKRTAEYRITNVEFRRKEFCRLSSDFCLQIFGRSVE
jgi:hypothetical protein